MEDWQAETLRYIWKKMKLDECITKNSSYSDMTISQRVYQFPNGIKVTSKTAAPIRNYAEMKILVNPENESTVLTNSIQ